ncbi:peptidase M48 [Massilia sp. Root418]|uniref:M48 family metalloprotease n=1 Tax=Massilia sp. Root418 TaxID=1736532 RepID=UPI0006FE1F8B|nr:M48 family metalloprotease [Massilia sp. Root418]KQW91450.1 peptidase M48 [Massilia sp. Root418]
MRHPACSAVLLAACFLPQAAPAQVPDSGRWQELRFGAEEVGRHMEDRYIEQVVDLAAAGRLDADRALLHRLRYVSAELIAAAVGLKPEAASWAWEVHLAAGPDIDAVCLAGGKLLVGADFVRRLDLTDDELAVLLAHEVAHAIAEHTREFLSEAQLAYRPLVPVEVVMLRLDSDLSLQLRLSSLSRMQEREADQLGMVIAHRAGWPVSAMLSFYRKLAEAEDGEPLIASHPSHASRISMSRGMARLLEP